MKTQQTTDQPLDNRQLSRRKALKSVVWTFVGVAATVLTTEKASAGYGACSVSGCYCQGYMGSGPQCQNCGHQYGAHW